MFSFKEYLFEAKVKRAFSLSSNSKGVLHELLVGYHLNGEKHLEKHENIDGLSPEQAHDKIAAAAGGTNSPEYKEAFRKAKLAADHIRSQIPGEISRVHWTSKHGDIKRSTGIESTQEQDASDIVVSTKDGKYHGVSLKLTGKKKEPQVSNPGLESTYGGRQFHEEHKAAILKKYPKLANMSVVEREEEMRNNPAMEKDIKARNSQLLDKITQHTHEQLKNMGTEAVAEHVRKLLHAHQTPMQKAGHNHIRHTMYGDDTFRAINPHDHFNEKLNDHKNITFKRTGTSIIFSHKGIPFATHRMKFKSQVDPLSSVKGSGEEAELNKAQKKRAQEIYSSPQKTQSAPVQKLSSVTPKKPAQTKPQTRQSITPEESSRLADDNKPSGEMFGHSYHGPGEKEQ
jgi:hypothetical protein